MVDINSPSAFALKDLTYSFESERVYKSDVAKMIRCSELYAERSIHRFQLGAGIFSSGTWLSGGCNERRAHARLHPYREALHAEQVAIMSARTDIEGSTIYVCRLGDSAHMLARPCYWCMHLILNAGISRVVFTTEEGGLDSFRSSSVEIVSIKSLGLQC